MMAGTRALTRPPRIQAGAPVATKPRWSAAHWLALIGVPILIHEVWSVTAWLLDGPFQITEYRDRNDPSWYAARALEGVGILVAIVVLIIVIRGCRRERTVFTFDAMYCMAGATLFYADGSVNVLAPTWLQSSQFVNVNNICGYMPFVVNPDCSRLPDAILLWFTLETFGLLGIAMLTAKGISLVRRSWTHWSKLRFFLVVMLIGIVFDGLLEVGYFMQFQLYSYGALGGPTTNFGGVLFPWWVLIPNGVWFGSYVCLKIFKDDRGLTLVERGLERHTPWKRRAITLMALYAAFQLIFWSMSIPWWISSFYQSEWPSDMPKHVVNGVCDTGGFTDTRYGPCPGSDGFRMPLRSLPGDPVGAGG